jgi:curved DNA-binding protein CbpA
VSGDRYKGFVFVPADLAEEVDLTLEQKKEIAYLSANLAKLTYWELLGVPWNATAEAAKEAFHRQAMLLHPDRHRGKSLGSYGPRLAKVFPRLTEARETLADPQKREAYARSTASPEERARMQLRQIEDERRSEERRARLARQNPLVARGSQVADIQARARRAMEEGRWQQAANDFQTVAAMDPRNLDAKRLAEECRRNLGAGRAAEEYEHGLKAELAGQVQSALALFQRAAETDPQNARYAIAASRASRAAGNPAGAAEMAARAVRAAPGSADAHVEHAEALAAAGQVRDAKKALERALAISSEHEGARALSRRLRWKF